MAYLLDTNACIALINGSSELVRRRFSRAVGSGEEVWVPSVSVFELWYGVAKSMQTDANTRRVKMFLEGLVRVLEFGEEDARDAGEIRNTLERMGRPIGTCEVLIAGRALKRNRKLVKVRAEGFR